MRALPAARTANPAATVSPIKSASLKTSFVRKNWSMMIARQAALAVSGRRRNAPGVTPIDRLKALLNAASES